jgi:hypothetical protein
MLASELARKPEASLPAQMGTPAATKAVYRFLQSSSVSYERLMRPHLQQTKDLMKEHRRVLLIQDTTEVDFYLHPKTSGLSQVGKKANHQGYLLQTVLAVEPSSKHVLGIAAEASLFASAGSSRRNQPSARQAKGQRIAGVAAASREHWASPPRM